MKKQITRYSSDTGQEERYDLVTISETVTIKNQPLTTSHQYYRRASDGQLFEPFDDPDFNLRQDYAEFRRKNQLLSSKEIQTIREKYRLSIREFAGLLGVSYANLSAIENGGIQSKYLDSLLRLADNEAAFKDLLQVRKADLSEKTLQRFFD